MKELATLEYILVVLTLCCFVQSFFFLLLCLFFHFLKYCNAVFNVINTLLTLFLLIFSKPYEIKLPSTLQLAELKFLPQLQRSSRSLKNLAHLMASSLYKLLQYAMFTIPIDYLMLALPLKYWPFLHILINTSIDFIISQLDSSAWYHSGANTHLTSSQSIHLDTFYCFFFYFKLLSIVKPHHCASGMYYLMNSFKATHFDILNFLSWFF